MGIFYIYTHEVNYYTPINLPSHRSIHHRRQRSTNQTLPSKTLLTLLAHLPTRRIIALVDAVRRRHPRTTLASRLIHPMVPRRPRRPRHRPRLAPVPSRCSSTRRPTRWQWPQRAGMAVVRPDPKSIRRRGVVVICREESTTQRVDVRWVTLQTRDLLSLGPDIQRRRLGVLAGSVTGNQQGGRTQRRRRARLVDVDIDFAVLIVVVCVWWCHEVSQEPS